MDNNQNLEDVKLLRILPELYDWGNIVEKLGEDGMMSLMDTIDELDQKGMTIGADNGQLTVDWDMRREVHGRLADHDERLKKHGFQFRGGEHIYKEEGGQWNKGYYQFVHQFIDLS